MNNLDSQQRQDALKRRWQERILTGTAMENQQNYQPSPSNFYTRLIGATPSSTANHNNSSTTLQSFPGLDHEDLVSTVIPSVTVVLEGRSICQRINLHKHSSYQSLAKALRQMFVDVGDAACFTNSDNELDLSNAVPGHLIAYEDMENDLLLAGDLKWKDFVRVAKRIRILPVKGNSKKGRGSV